jgi:hypothetical protein
LKVFLCHSWQQQKGKCWSQIRARFGDTARISRPEIHILKLFLFSNTHTKRQESRPVLRLVLHVGCTGFRAKRVHF